MIKIASVGECMIELRHRSESELDLAFGGDTLNTAVYLARLLRNRETSVDYVTALGTDPYSDAMLAMWREEGVGTRFVARLADRLPGLYTIRTDARGERTFTYWRSVSAARKTLDGERGEDLIGRLAGVDLLYASGITLSILDPAQRATLLEIAEAVRSRGGRVAFDTNYRPVGWPDPEIARHAFDAMLERADIALPTLDDDRRLFGGEDPEGCAARIHELGVKEVVVKLGGAGCYISSDHAQEQVPAEAVPTTVDSTAAGDSFNAGYLAARLIGAEPGTAAALGNRLAAIVIQHPGAVVPTEATAGVVV
jgi:2-dehydro-3-deoxygluconokinase